MNPTANQIGPIPLFNRVSDTSIDMKRAVYQAESKRYLPPITIRESVIKALFALKQAAERIIFYLFSTSTASKNHEAILPYTIAFTNFFLELSKMMLPVI